MKAAPRATSATTATTMPPPRTSLERPPALAAGGAPVAAAGGAAGRGGMGKSQAGFPGSACDAAAPAAAGGPSRPPHEMQNRRPAGLACPQIPHVTPPAEPAGGAAGGGTVAGGPRAAGTPAGTGAAGAGAAGAGAAGAAAAAGPRPAPPRRPPLPRTPGTRRSCRRTRRPERSLCRISDRSLARWSSRSGRWYPGARAAIDPPARARGSATGPPHRRRTMTRSVRSRNVCVETRGGVPVGRVTRKRAVGDSNPERSTIARRFRGPTTSLGSTSTCAMNEPSASVCARVRGTGVMPLVHANVTG